jgi:hypothetical protein
MSERRVLVLTFLLPPVYRLGVPIGRYSPCIAGCMATIADDFIVRIEGTTRDLIFEQAQRLLRVVGRNHMPQQIMATLHTPAPTAGGAGYRDGWSIAVNASVYFSPTGLGGDLYPRVEPRPRNVHN